MEILIIENEVYLAQSIASKLSHFGFNCEIISSTQEALEHDKADIVLLSTSISGQNFYPLIEKFCDSIVILMVPYVNDDTVTRPLQAGASDYIVKPFMIDELVRKIRQHTNFRQLQKEIAFYRDYFCSSLLTSSHTINSKISFPLIIKSTSQKAIDMCVAHYAIHKKLPIDFLSLYENKDYHKILKSTSKQKLTYVIGFETLSKEDRENCIKSLKNTPIIFSCLNGEAGNFPNVYEIETKDISQGFHEEILSVDDYVKTMILNFEDKYPDTELSKKLGMSRKSLWEKRKKYGITKKK